jgi:hypothetical protein
LCREHQQSISEQKVDQERQFKEGCAGRLELSVDNVDDHSCKFGKFRRSQIKIERLYGCRFDNLAIVNPRSLIMVPIVNSIIYVVENFLNLHRVKVINVVMKHLYFISSLLTDKFHRF